MSLDLSEIRFDDLTPISIPVTLGAKSYVLKEATGDASTRYKNALMSSTKMGKDGKPSHVEGLANVEPLLVSLCLFESYEVRGGELKERPVTESFIRGLPGKIQKKLFEKVKEISGLSEEDTLETLEKQQAELSEKIAALREKQQSELRTNTESNGDTHAKKLLSSTLDGSN